MSILDDAIAANTNGGNGIDAILDRATKSLNRVQQLSQNPVAGLGATRTYGEVRNFSDDDNYSKKVISDKERLDNQEANYLQAQRESYEARRAEREDDWTSDENLYSSNPLVNVGSNALNLGKRALGGLGQAATGFMQYGAEARRDWVAKGIPEDIRNTFMRIQNRASLGSNQARYNELEETLMSGRFDSSERKKIESEMEALSYAINNSEVSREEYSRYINATDENGESYEKRLGKMALAQSVYDTISGDPKKGIPSMLGAENWGNRITDENARLLVDSDRISKGVEEAEGLWKEGNYGGAVAEGLKSFGTQLGEWGSAMIDNPGAILGMAADSAAYMNPATAIPAALGLAGKTYAEGANQYREKYQQELGGADQAKVGAIAAAMGGLGYAQGKIESSALMGKFGGAIDDAARATVGGVAKGTSAVSGATIKNIPYAGGILDGAVRGAGAIARETAPIATRVGAATLAEGTAEAAQSVLEQNAGLQGEFDLEQTGESFALGGVLGGSLAAPGAAVATGVGYISDRFAEKNEEEYGSAEVTNEELLNPDSPNYSPRKVINRNATEVLKKETSAERKAEIHQEVETAYAAAAESYKVISNRYENATNLESLADMDAWEQRMDERRANFDPSRLDLFDATRAKARDARLKDIEQAKIDVEQLDEMKKVMDSAEEEFKLAQQSYNAYQSWYKDNKPEEVEAEQVAPTTATEDSSAEQEAAPTQGFPGFTRTAEANEATFDNVEASMDTILDVFTQDDGSLAPLTAEALQSTLGVEDAVAEALLVSYKAEGIVDADGKFVTPSESTSAPVSQAQAPKVSPVESEASNLLGAPNFGEVKRMQQLAKDPTVPEALRNQLRVVSEALIAENALKNIPRVSKQVNLGVGDYLGTSTYLKDFKQALDTGNIAAQKALTANLAKFNKGMSSKAAAVREAHEWLVNTDNNPNGKRRSLQVVRKANSPEWYVDYKGEVKSSDFNKNNGLLIHIPRSGTNGSLPVIEAIEANALSVQKTAEAFELMRNEKANPASADPFDLAMDELNAAERVQGRDTTARDTDPKAQVVTPAVQQEVPVVQENLAPQEETRLENNEGDLVDNSSQEYFDPFDIEVENEFDPMDGIDLPEPTPAKSSEPAAVTPPKSESVEPTKKAPDSDKGESRNEKAPKKAEKQVTNQDGTSLTKDEAEILAKKMSAKTGSNWVAKAVLGGYDIVEKEAKAITEVAVDSLPKAKPAADKRKAKRKAVSEGAREKVKANEDKATYDDGANAPKETDVEGTTLQNGDVDASPEGALSIFDTQGKSYKESISEEAAKDLEQGLPNLVKLGFVQRLKAGINSPLVELKNFSKRMATAMRMRGRKVAVKAFLQSKGLEATDAEVSRTIDFFVFNHDFTKTLVAQMAPKANEQYFTDGMIDFLMTGEQGDRKFDDNLLTAMSLAAYEWVGTHSVMGSATVSELGAKVFVSNAKVVPEIVHTTLGTVGTYNNEVMKELGATVLDALQLKSLASADKDLRSKVTMALGAYILEAMNTNGLVQVTDVKLSLLNELRDIVKEANAEDFKVTEEKLAGDIKEQGKITFIRPALMLDQNLEPVIDGFSYAVQDTVSRMGRIRKSAPSVLTKVFGHTPDIQMPSAEPIATTPEQVDALGTQTSEFQKDVILKQQGTAYVINNRMYNGFQALYQLGVEGFDVMLGYQDPTKVLKIREASVISRNDQISRGLAILDGTKAEFNDTGFFLPLSVWSNLRSGIAAAFNPQADKIHRAFSALETDVIMVPSRETDVLDKNGEFTKYGMFLRGLGLRLEDAQNLTGVNGELAKEDKYTYVSELDAYINTDEVRAAAQAYNRVLKGEGTKEDGKLVVDLVTSWGIESLGLSVLDALAAREEALETGSVYESYVFGESDGSNNGPAITGTMMNTLTPELRNSVGIFTYTDQANNLVEFRANGGKDMYVQLAAHKERILANLTASLNEDAERFSKLEMEGKLSNVPTEYSDSLLRSSDSLIALEAISRLDPVFAGRKGAKRDLVPFNYGAGMKAVKRASSREFIEGIYDQAEKAIQEGNLAAMYNLADNINLVLKHASLVSGGTPAPQLKKTEALMDLNFELSGHQILALRTAEENLRGPVIESSLNEFLSGYISARNQFSGMSESSYNLFEIMYEQELALELAAYYRENPKAAKDGSNLPKAMHDKLLARLRKYMPKINVPMGLESTQFGSVAIPLVDTTKNWSNKALKVPYRRPARQYLRIDSIGEPAYLAWEKESGKNGSSVSAAIEDNALKSPGVGAIAKFIQSVDAYVAFRTMQVFNVQNYHDSNSMNPYEIEAMARGQNEFFLDGTTLAHIGESFMNALLDPLQAYSDGLVDLNKATIGKLNKQMFSMYRKFGIEEGTDLRQGLKLMASMLIQQDIAKLDNYINNVKSIGQYGTQGGEFIMTTEKRAEILKRKKALINRYKKMEARIDKLADGFKGQVANNLGSKRTLSMREIKAIEMENAKPTMSPTEMALLNNRDNLQDPYAFSKFVDKLISEHIHTESNVGKYAQMYRHLLRATQSSLGGLEVNLFMDTENTAEILGYQDAVKNGTSAWYINQDGKRQINVRIGTNGKINSTVLVHELLHAATADALAQVKANPAAFPKAERAYKGLEALRAQVEEAVNKAYPQDVNDKSRTDVSREEYLVKYAAQNVEELIATGLTDPTVIRFMDKLVANPSKGRGLSVLKTSSVVRKVVDGVISIMRDVFKKEGAFNSKTATAYEALVLDVADFLQSTSNINRDKDIQGGMFGAPKGTGLDDVQNMSAEETFKNLNGDGLDPSFSKDLSNNVMRMADRVLRTLPKDYKGTGRFSPENIWNHALETGEAPYQTDAVKAGFAMTDKEQFATEILELVIGDTAKDEQLSEAMREMVRVFDLTKAKVKVEDLAAVEWAKASAEQKAEALAKYNYLFDTKRKDYLARFAAMALGNAEVNKLLAFNASYKANNKRDNDYFGKLYSYFDQAADLVIGKHLGVQDMKGNSRIKGIVRKLIDVSNKNKNKAMEAIEYGLSKADTFTNEKVLEITGAATDAVLDTNPRTTAGRLVRNATATVLGGKTMQVFEVAAMTRDQMFKNSTLGFVGELGKEIGDVTKEGRTVEALLRIQKANETHAQRLRTEIKTDLVSMFKNADGTTKQLDKSTREAVTATYLRSDIQSLTTNYTGKQIQELVSNPTKIKEEIDKVKKGLPSMQVARAKMLGWYMVSGIGHNLLAKNAYAIASNAGLGIRTADPSEATVQQIDELATLYALSYTSNDKLKAVADLYKDNTEALEAVIKYHKGLVNDSREYLFADTEMNMTKGYMPEVTNHHKAIEVARTQADADRLRSAMYKEIGPVNRDPQDVGGFTPIMFYTEDSTKQGYVSGAITLYNYGAKDTQVDMDPMDIADFQNNVRGMKFDASWDPRTETQGSMIPKYDNEGNVTGYRYEMSAHKRDTLLERNNDFSDLIGAFTALGYTKVSNVEQNMTVVDALYDQYKAAKTLDRNRYVYVSYESTDPVAYEAWNRLSNETKQYVKEKWGSYGMWVPNDVFLTVFGAPKRSLLTESFDKNPSVQNVAERMYTEVMKAVFKGNARVVAAKTERMWQEAVALSKNFVVIRNLSTLMMNLASNTFLLMAHGVPVSELIKNTRDSIKGGMQYRKDIALLTRLEARLRSGVGDMVATQSQINQLTNRLSANPMNEFIEAGMFSGIVEDVDPTQDMYSYQSALQRKYDGYYNKIPYVMRRAAEYAFVTPSTPIYQFLHSATQYSDFSAKYVLYKHLTETATEKMSKEEALQEASDNFINYDVPTSPWLQYANDMGLVMFTKYNLRIQKALFRLIAKRPASAIGQAILMNSTTSLPPGIDPIVFNQYGNPFRDGAFSIFGTVDEPFPIKALF